MELGLLFTYALTYGGAFVSLFNPYIGLLIYVCFAVCNPQAMWYWSVPEGNYSRIVAIALLVGWGLQGFGNWKLGQARGIVLAFCGFWFWSILSTLQSSDQARGIAFVEANAKILLPFLVGITVIDSVDKLRKLAWVIVGSMGFVAYEYNLDYFKGFNRFDVNWAGLDNNSLAIAFVTCAGMAFFLGLHADGWWRKLIGFGAAGLMAHTVLFSMSRGGMLALTVTGAATFWLIPKKPMHCLVFALAVAIGLQMAGAEVRARFMTSFVSEEERDGSAQSRVVLWGNCIHAMVRRPIFGIGPHQFPLIVHEYGWLPGKEAHTLWLQIGAELGFPGLFCLASFYLLCVARLVRLMNSKAAASDPWFGYFGHMVVASIVGFAVAAQFVSLWGLEVPYYVVLVGAGALKLSSVPSTQSDAVGAYCAEEPQLQPIAI